MAIWPPTAPARRAQHCLGFTGRFERCDARTEAHRRERFHRDLVGPLDEMWAEMKTGIYGDFNRSDLDEQHPSRRQMPQVGGGACTVGTDTLGLEALV
jgi:hypothetical protein